MDTLTIKILLGKYSKKELFKLIVDHLMVLEALGKTDRKRFEYFSLALQEMCKINQPLWRKVLKALEKNGIRV